MELKYSSIILFLLEKKCPINGTRTWDDPIRLARIGITVKPPFVCDDRYPSKRSRVYTRVPVGLSLSRMRAFLRFIHLLRVLPEARRLRFIDQKGGLEDTGRQVWRRWFRTTIKHRLYHAITKLFIFVGVHPVQLMYRTGGAQMVDEVPDTLAYTTIVGIDIFGPSVTYEGTDLTYCRQNAYMYIQSVVEIWWRRSYKTWNLVNAIDIPEFRENAKDAISGLVSLGRPLRLEDLRLAQEEVNNFEKMACWYPAEATAIESYKAILEGVWLKVGKGIRRAVYPRAALLREAGLAIGSSIDVLESDFIDYPEVEAVWGLFVKYFSDLKPIFESKPQWNAEILQGLEGCG